MYPLLVYPSLIMTHPCRSYNSCTEALKSCFSQQHKGMLLLVKQPLIFWLHPFSLATVYKIILLLSRLSWFLIQWYFCKHLHVF
jgi:hypothetical protein